MQYSNDLAPHSLKSPLLPPGSPRGKSPYTFFVPVLMLRTGWRVKWPEQGIEEGPGPSDHLLRWGERQEEGGLGERQCEVRSPLRIQACKGRCYIYNKHTHPNTIQTQIQYLQRLVLHKHTHPNRNTYTDTPVHIAFIETVKQCASSFNITFSCHKLGKASKNGYFKVRLAVSGDGGVSHLGPDRKQMWKCWPIFHWNLILWYSKHILSHCEGWLQIIIRRCRRPPSSTKRRNWGF